jgi:hypothetical protein
MKHRGFACWATVVVAVYVALLDVAAAQTESPNATTEKRGQAETTSPVDPTGTWKWDYTFGDNTAEFKLKLNWDGKELTGKYTAFDRTSDIEQATLDKDQLTFAVKREFNGEEFEINFEGQAELDEINGTIKLDFGGEPRELEWNASRAVEIDDVVGTWDLRVKTESGVVEPKLTITKDGEKLRGKSVTSTFGELEAKNLALKDNELSWEITTESNGSEFHIKYKGKPRGNVIEGSNEFSVDGNTGTMEFTGKRTPPDEKKEKHADEAKSAVGPAAEGDGADTTRQ